MKKLTFLDIISRESGMRPKATKKLFKKIKLDQEKRAICEGSKNRQKKIKYFKQYEAI